MFSPTTLIKSYKILQPLKIKPNRYMTYSMYEDLAVLPSLLLQHHRAE